MYNYKNYLLTALVTLFASCSLMLQAACVDAVVLVHGNTATPASWNNTYNYLLTKGYSSSIWGENASYNYLPGHFGLQTDTAAQQYQLIK
ncbi:hypothetical protein HRH59_09180 [Rheinheimera sp. YQF-2]|uniref:Alpha/beta hydrolase n=1 Tax=Rheinheimera lutimaris TaxID=2740584 RepID=A0A7Y5EHS1_9GAMM|nr:hypothetical protein [Rheinheimera lutimaris]NRQ42734.1 hypothetical protein [Rheinheimera lutimaris]